MTTQPFLHQLTSTIRTPIQVWSEPSGQLQPHGAQGIYCFDDRVISSAVVSIDTAEIEHVRTREIDAGHTEFTSAIKAAGWPADPKLILTRERSVDNKGVFEAMSFANGHDKPFYGTIHLYLTIDGTNMSAIKAGSLTNPSLMKLDNFTWSWGRPQTRATLRSNDASEIAFDIDSRSARLTWEICVSPGSRTELQWGIDIFHQDAPFSPAQGRRPIAKATSDLNLGAIDADLQLDIRNLVSTAASDLDSLLLAEWGKSKDIFLAAGAPWFFTLFGRDSIISAIFLADLAPEIGLGTLRVLARRQGVKLNLTTAEEPGKILHEVRNDGITTESPDAVLKLPPVYYGTIDATPLWVRLFVTLWDLGHQKELTTLIPNLLRALEWITETSSQSDDGFLRYIDPTGTGLANQGWKDSGDAIRSLEARKATAPIALCEVQGYAYDALQNGARILASLGYEVETYHASAEIIREQFHRRFWIEDEHGRYPAMAIDANGIAISGHSSNMGHLLGTGILDREDEVEIVSRLLGEDMFSGYGIRTLTTDSVAFHPLSYHCGSVWTHDNGIIISGMLIRGFIREAKVVARALVDAARHFHYRLPELFGGDARSNDFPPLPYPASCRPQAWAAASMIPILQALSK